MLRERAILLAVLLVCIIAALWVRPDRPRANECIVAPSAMPATWATRPC